MFRVALVSRWHGHSHKPDERYVKEFLKQPDCSVVAVWDKDPTVAEEWAKEYGVNAEPTLEALLVREDVDGILVTSAPQDHREIFIKAAEHKKHIFTEKVLALTLEDAYAIRDAIKKNGVKFYISFMRLGIKQFAYAKKLIDDGTLGKPVQFRCLCGHRGGLNGDLPEYWYDPDVCGGGAMIDLGFNSAYLARYIMGDMESVSSNFGYSVLNKKVEDNASCSVSFKSGAIGSIDATFTSPLMSVFELAVYGTDGAYYTRFGGCDMAQLHLNGEEVKDIPLDEIPVILDNPVVAWVKACTEGASDEIYGIDAAVDMVKFMVAAYRSHENGGRHEMV
ncbi:MAG: Gfo/Idh/MocA family oxidoreductase [Clostridia bacterium]|nr:Gfo/Idh/MocA family oxidoreductase [Clostridia bacterium]